MFTPSIVVDSVIDALADFVEPFLNGGKCYRTQQNRVPLPKAPCAMLTEITTVRLETSAVEFDSDNQISEIVTPTRIDIQVDIYGEASGDQATGLAAALGSQWAWEQFPAHIKPLYASDPIQAPSVTGEQQYSGRWSVTASLQYNPSVTVPSPSAVVLSMGTPVVSD